MAGRIRIEATGDTGKTSRVIYVKSDGEEIDISDVVQKVEFSTSVGDANRATIHVIMVRGDLAARYIDLIRVLSGPYVSESTVIADEYVHLAPPSSGEAAA